VTWNGLGLDPVLVLEVIVGNLLIARNAQSVEVGLKCSTRWLLRIGIVLFWPSLTLQQVFVLGPKIVLLDLMAMTTVMIVRYPLGTRWLKFAPETALPPQCGKRHQWCGAHEPDEACGDGHVQGVCHQLSVHP
jgi:uncharacterized membrane protein YadS